MNKPPIENSAKPSDTDFFRHFDCPALRAFLGRSSKRCVAATLILLLAPIFLCCSDGIMNVGGRLDSDSSTTAEDSAAVLCYDGGVWYDSNCWYLGLPGESCIDVCAQRGGYSDATSTITGTPSEGGDWEDCRNIFRLMGFDGEVGAASRLSLASEGLGCHIWNGGLWWLFHPDLNPEAAYGIAERVCACLQNESQ